MSIPKEPRQLMINIMYLVLTALLALNVSAEIFNAFNMVDKGLKSANASLDEKNELLPDVIKDRAKKNAAFETYADRVDIARRLSQEASAKIDALVDTLIDQSGDRNGSADEGDYVIDKNGNREFKGIRNYDAVTRLMVEGGKGEALREMLIDYKAKFLELIDEDERPSYESKIPIDIDNDTWKNSMTPRENWADFTFSHMPLGATMPIFSKFKNDLKSSEASVLNYLMGKVGGEEVILDKFKVVSSPKKTYVIKGEQFETDIFLSAAAGEGSKTGISISVNGSPLRMDGEGVAKFTAPAGSAGKKTYKADITVTNPVTGDKKTYTSSFEYEVGERSVTVSPSKMNVFYIGVDNPVEISAAGVSSNKMNVSTGGAGGASIKPNSDGTYNVRVTTPTAKGEFAKINVSADGLNVSKDFRVKRIPDPVPMLGNNRGGKMSSGEFKVYTSVRAALDNFDFDATCDIVGFQLVYVPRRKDAEISINPRGKYNPDSERLAQKATPGDRFFFENIKCKCPGDNASRDIGSMSVLIN